MSATQPANLLFTTIDGGGNVAPVMGVVDDLVVRGHRLRVMSDSVNRREAETAGARFVPWTRAPNKAVRSRETDPRDWEAPNPLAGIAAMLEHFCCGCARLYAQDVIAELRREPADLVINFDMLFGVMVACEALGQRLALLSTMTSMFPLPGVPPFGFAMRPARSVAGRRAIDVANDRLAAMFDTGLPALNEARVELGLAPLRRTLDQLNAVTLRWLGTARAFDFLPDSPPPFLHYVGPLIRDPVDAAPWVSAWSLDDRRPLVLGSFSTSFQGHIDCLQRVIDACAAMPVRLLVTLGGSVQADELRPAANTQIVESAPHTQVMREAALVVTHGGHGTVMTAIMHRLPILVIPHGRDQGDNAVRIQERGAGLWVRNTVGSAEMAAALRRLLSEPAFAAAAKKLGDAVEAEVEQSRLIEEIEAVAGSKM